MDSIQFKSIKVEEKEKMDFQDGNNNPFCYDFFHMGQPIGKNTMLMFANHSNENMEYMILVNTKTGERIEISFDESWID